MVGWFGKCKKIAYTSAIQNERQNVYSSALKKVELAKAECHDNTIALLEWMEQ